MNANIDDKHNRFALNSDISEADIEIERALAELHGLVPRETNLNPNGNENRRTLSEVPSSKILSKITKQATSHPEDVLVSEEKQKIKPSSKYFVQLTHDNIRNTLKYTPKKEQNKTQDEGLRSDRRNDLDDYFYYQETERKLPKVPGLGNNVTADKRFIDNSEYLAESSNENYSRSPISSRDYKPNKSFYDKEMVRNYSKPDYVAVGYVKQSDKKTKVNYTQIDNYEPHQDYIRIEDRLLHLGKQKDQKLNMLRTQEEQKLKDLAARKKHSLGSTSKLDGSVSPRYTGSGAISNRKLSPRPEMASKTDLALRTEMTPRTDRNKTTNVPRSTTPGNRNGEEMNYVRITTKGEGKDSRDPYQPPRNSNAFIQAIDNIQRSSNQMLEYLLTSRNSKHLLNRSSTPVKHNDENIRQMFTPNITQKSKEIASKLGNATDRILRANTQKIKEIKREALVELTENELTFKPKINDSSKKLDKNFKAHQFNGDQLHRWDQLYLMKDKYLIDKQLKKIEREKSEMENDKCTFHPHINRKSANVHRESKSPLTERMKMWQDTKERKLSKTREERERKELSECTFKPSINKPTSALEYSLSPAHYENMNVQVRGLDQHFERIDIVNRRKKEVEHKLSKHQGHNWKNQITIPQEFNFHLAGNIFIPTPRSKRSISPTQNSQRSFNGQESFRNPRSPVRIHENYSPKRGEYRDDFEKRVYRHNY